MIEYDIFNSDCLTWLKTRSDKSIDCIITSPPYWGLRTYLPNDHELKDAEIGLEAAPDCLGWATGNSCHVCYVCHIVKIFREARRVLTDQATMWLNFGDTYARSPKKGGSGTYNGRNGYGEGYAGALRPLPSGIKPKNLIGIPWRVALALQSDGWWLRSDVIWDKTNVITESVRDRPTKAHEYIFLLSKSEKYYYNYDAVREIGKNGKPRNKRTVWTLPKSHFRPKDVGIDSIHHFASYPPKLVLPCVLASCPKEGVVLDPFCGSASTGVACIQADRNFIGIEVSPEYVTLGKARLSCEISHRHADGI